MLDIGQYIKHLLNFYPQVGLSGIGVFSKQRISARYDEATQRFLPPGFTYRLTVEGDQERDQLLLHYVSQKYQLPVEEAQREIDAVVTELITQLKTNNTVEIDPLGTLNFANGDTTFLSRELSWGLQPVNTFPMASKVLEGVESPVEQPLEVEIPAPVIEEDVEEAEKTRKNGWIWGIAIISLAAMLSFYIWYQFGRKSTTVDKRQVKIQHALEPDTLTQAMPTSASADTLVTDSMLPAQNPSENSEKQGTETSTEQPLVKKASEAAPFTIVIGSFKKLNLAIEQAKYFRSIGIEAFVQDSKVPRNRKKICYGSYLTRAAALKDLERVRKEISREAYIYP